MKKISVIVFLVAGTLTVSGCYKTSGDIPSAVNEEAGTEQVAETEYTAILDSEDVSINTSNWQTYLNEQYGFEMKYPEEWKVKKRDYTTELILAKFVFQHGADEHGIYPKNELTLTIKDGLAYSRYNIDFKNIDTLLGSQNCSTGPILPIKTIDGMSSIVSCGNYNGNGYKEMYFFSHNDRIFLFEASGVDYSENADYFEWLKSEKRKTKYYSYQGAKEFDFSIERKMIQTLLMLNQ